MDRDKVRLRQKQPLLSHGIDGTQTPVEKVVLGEIVTCDKQLSPLTMLSVIQALLAVSFLFLFFYCTATSNGRITFSWKWITLIWGPLTFVLTLLHWFFHTAYLRTTRTPYRSGADAVSHPKHFPGLPMICQLYDTVFTATLALMLIAVVISSYIVSAGGFIKAETADRAAQSSNILVIELVCLVSLHALFVGLRAQMRPLIAVQDMVLRLLPSKGRQ